MTWRATRIDAEGCAANEPTRKADLRTHHTKKRFRTAPLSRSSNGSDRRHSGVDEGPVPTQQQQQPRVGRKQQLL